MIERQSTKCGICLYQPATVFMVVTQLPKPGVAKEHVCLDCFERVRDSMTGAEGATVQNVSQQEFNETNETASRN